MKIDDIITLAQFGKFEEAIDLIDEELASIKRGSKDFIKYNRLKSRYYYHQGRIDQALYFINEVLQFGNNLQDILSKSLYNFAEGEIEKVRHTLNTTDVTTWTDAKFSDDVERIQGLSTYYLIQGLMAEFDGKLKDAKVDLEESLSYSELLDDKYESNIIYYKLATIERMLGNFNVATSHLHTSLKLSKNLNLIKEIATSTTLIGQDHLMREEYNDAIPYLEDGVEFWKRQGSPFGIIWALGELSIIQFLTGNREIAFKQYKEIIELSNGIMPPFNYSTHLLNAIRFALSIDNFNEADALLSELKETEENTKNPYITQRLQLAEFLVTSKTQRIREKLSNISFLEDLRQDTKEAMLSYISLIEIIKLLLLEFSLTEIQQLGNEILNDVKDRIEDLLRNIHLRMGISFELHSAVLRDNIDSLRYNPKLVFKMIDLLDNSSLSQPLFIKEKLEEWSNDPAWFFESTISEDFKFKKEFQSIPNLKILLYLLPRSYATFSDLQNTTGLSSGHLSGTCKKLEEMRLIIRGKRFIEERPISTYSISSTGYLELKEYLKNLEQYLTTLF